MSPGWTAVQLMADISFQALAHDVPPALLPRLETYQLRPVEVGLGVAVAVGVEPDPARTKWMSSTVSLPRDRRARPS